MVRFFHPLLLLLANATHRDMVAQIQYLKAENAILRSKLPKRITVTPAERARLVKLGSKVRKFIGELISIVSPRTFLRWVAESKKETKASDKPKRKPGRPRTPQEISELILRLARENHWGYTRILGELKKLGIKSVSKSTVRNILKAASLEPGPDRGEGSWDQFVRMHAESLWACDFLSKKIWTLRGLVDYFVIIWINVKSREVIVSPATATPDSAWVTQQARNFLHDASDRGKEVGHLIHDWDTKFPAQFDAILESQGAEIHRLGPVKPNLNAYAERVIQSIQQECLDHFVVLGEKHLNHLVSEYVEHYNTERPHRALEKPPLSADLPEATANSRVVCKERLGGLLKHYYRQAA